MLLRIIILKYEFNHSIVTNPDEELKEEVKIQENQKNQNTDNQAQLIADIKKVLDILEQKNAGSQTQSNQQTIDNSSQLDQSTQQIKHKTPEKPGQNQTLDLESDINKLGTSSATNRKISFDQSNLNSTNQEFKQKLQEDLNSISGIDFMSTTNQQQKATANKFQIDTLNQTTQSQALQEIQQNGRQISKLIKENSNENIILTYLQKRSELMMHKLSMLGQKVNVTMNDMQHDIRDLELKVKGQIQTQHMLYDLRNSRLQEQQTRLENRGQLNQSSFQMSMFESEVLANQEKQRIQEMFTNCENQLMDYFQNNCLKEASELTRKISNQEILSLSKCQFHYRDRSHQGEAIDYIVVRGQQDFIYFVDPLTMNIERSLQIQNAWGQHNIGWIIQIEDQLIFQLYNKHADILIYQDEEYVKFWTPNEIFLKPIVIIQNLKIYFLFAGIQGKLYLYEYDKRQRIFTQVDVYSIASELNQSQTSVNISTLSMQTQESQIICLKQLKLSKFYAVGLKNGGVHLFGIDFERNRLSKYDRYLDGQTIKDVCELDKDLILVQMQEDPYFVSYHKINLASKECLNLGNGFGKYPESITLFPGYHPVKYPYVLLKEQYHYSIFNPIQNTISLIHEEQERPDQKIHEFKEDTVIFIKNQGNSEYSGTFISEKDGYYLAKYEIHPHIIEALKLP
eukprot:403342734